MLPPTYSVGASVIVAMWDMENQRAIVPPSRIHPATALAQGYYEARVLLFVDGEGTQHTRRFRVGQAADELDWSPGSTSGT